MPSNAYNTLLAVAQQVKLWITPARQTYAEIPSGVVSLWSEEFFTWCFAQFNFQNFPASITYNKVLRALDETAQSQPREAIREINLRAAATKNGYEIDLGGPFVRLTGKQWKIKDGGPGLEPGSRFLRPIANRPLPNRTGKPRRRASRKVSGCGHCRHRFGDGSGAIKGALNYGPLRYPRRSHNEGALGRVD